MHDRWIEIEICCNNGPIKYENGHVDARVVDVDELSYCGRVGLGLTESVSESSARAMFTTWSQASRPWLRVASLHTVSSRHARNSLTCQ